MSDTASPDSLTRLRHQLDNWAAELGFQQIGVTKLDVGEHGQHLRDWLAAGYHGEMAYMANHDDLRWRPDKLVEGGLRVISARMDYLPPDTDMIGQLKRPERAYLSRYALGRDYHKLVRKRLSQLGKRLQHAAQDSGFRAFVDSAPILERALASQSGLGWIGKNTLLINRSAGSYFFLGELITSLPLPVDTPYAQNHCGRCQACLDICPTRAFVGPYVLDARRCISYLTIELDGPIPVELRPGIGNRIFGCDDCQIGCPWNRFSQTTDEADFQPRNDLDKATLLALFRWDEDEFLRRTEGMPLRRTGYRNWRRNLAVALGNAPRSIEVLDALTRARPAACSLVAEHIDWAIARQGDSPD